MSKTKIIDEEKNVSRNYQAHSAKLKKFYLNIKNNSVLKEDFGF